jgi:hypothetical protein
MFDIHAVDMVGPKNRHRALIVVIDQVEILEYRVSRSSIPRLITCADLSRGWNDEMIFKQATELPAVSQVFQK